MQMASLAILCMLLLATVSLSTALTDDEIAHFKTTEIIETYTGLTGMVTIVTSNGKHTIRSNGIPDHTALEYTQPGNTYITEQTYVWSIPVNPTIAATPTELPAGPVGVAINGIPFFDPYTLDGEDAVETDVFDSCDGHPTRTGVYHYHKQPSSCVFSIIETQPSSIIGVALDGFPIYGPIDENGNTLTSADLDECHGRYVNGEYRYHTTADFPYILGCYKGTYDRLPKPRQGGDFKTNLTKDQRFHGKRVCSNKNVALKNYWNGSIL